MKEKPKFIRCDIYVPMHLVYIKQKCTMGFTIFLSKALELASEHCQDELEKFVIQHVKDRAKRPHLAKRNGMKQLKWYKSYLRTLKNKKVKRLKDLKK